MATRVCFPFTDKNEELAGVRPLLALFSTFFFSADSVNAVETIGDVVGSILDELFNEEGTVLVIAHVARNIAQFDDSIRVITVTDSVIARNCQKDIDQLTVGY